MQRDDLIEDIVEEIKKVVSDNRELDGDDLDNIDTAVIHTTNCAEEAIDADEETANNEAEAAAKA